MAEAAGNGEETMPAGRAAVPLRPVDPHGADSGDLGRILADLLVPMMRLAGANAGAVRVLDGTGTRLGLVCSVGFPVSVASAEHTVRSDCGVCGQAAAGDAAVWSDELSGCTKASGTGYFASHCHRMVAMPLRHGGRLLGVYNLFFAAGGAPDERMQSALAAFGEILGLALDGARRERERVEAERQAMAAEVHDSIAQNLAFVKLRMPLLQQSVAAGELQAAGRYVEDVRAAVTEAHRIVRALLTRFRAPVDPLGFRHALGQSIAVFEGATGIALKFEDRAPGVVLSGAQESQLFRIVQEALTNVARHAGARQAWLTIDRHRDTIEVLVEDDGRGPPRRGPDGAHYGIDIMRERATRLGGHLEIGAREGGGTRVRVSVPVVATGCDP